MFLLAQIFSAVGAGLLLYSTFCDTKEGMLKIQVFDAAANAIADILLGGWAGVLLNISAIIRNVLAIKGKITNVIMVVMLAFTTLVSLKANHSGFLPLIAEIEYTIVVSKCDLLKSKIALAVDLFLWLIYDLVIKSYPVAIADVIILVSTLRQIAKMSNETGESKRIVSLDFNSKE